MNGGKTKGGIHMVYRYRTDGRVCSKEIEIELDGDGRIRRVRFAGGCSGNLTGIGLLVAGMTPEEVIDRLSGVSCGGKPTSCPDQLASALKSIQRERAGR